VVAAPRSSFGGGTNTLTLGPGFSITGNVGGAGSDVFQLGGSGTGSFNLSTIGTQYTGFGTFWRDWRDLVATGAGNQNWTISAGTLQLGNGGASGAITGNIVDNGTFAIDRSDTYTFAGALSGSGSFVQMGSGTAVLTGTNTYNGGTTISGGTLQVTNNSSVGTGTVTLNGGTFQSGAAGLNFSNAFAINTSGGTIDTQANTLTLGGAIGNGNGTTGALTMIGGGTLILSGTNSYTGGTTISAGALQVTNNSSVGTGTVTLNGGTFQSGAAGLNFSNAFAVNTSGGTIDTQANTLTLGAAIGNGNGATGALTKIGSGTLILSGTNSYTGATNVNAGNLQAGAANVFAPASGFTVASGATLNLNNFNETIGSLAGVGNVTLGSGILTLANASACSAGRSAAPVI